MFNMLQLLLRIRCICLSPAVFSDVLALPIFKQEDSSLPSENETKNPPFQYVLCTATSPAVKLHDETLTYLNQGERQQGVYLFNVSTSAVSLCLDLVHLSKAHFGVVHRFDAKVFGSLCCFLLEQQYIFLNCDKKICYTVLTVMLNRKQIKSNVNIFCLNQIRSNPLKVVKVPVAFWEEPRTSTEYDHGFCPSLLGQSYEVRMLDNRKAGELPELTNKMVKVRQLSQIINSTF